LTDPKQSSSTVEPNQPFFFDAIVRSHVQKKLVLADPQKNIARLSFYKRFGVKKWVGARRNKLHDESMLSKNDSFHYVGEGLRSPEATRLAQEKTRLANTG
jgi:hypothetical protein